MNDRTRVTLGKVLLLSSLVTLALATALVFATVIACLAGCGHFPVRDRILIYSTVGVALLVSVSCVVNFFFRLVRHGWKGLGGWEKAVAYIAIAGAVSPLIVDFAFWLT